MENQKQTVDLSYESIIKVILVLFILFFVFQLRHIIFIVFISVIVALIMNPAVDSMQKKKIPRVAGALVLFLFVFIAMGLLAYIVAPPLAKEVTQLASQLPNYLKQIDFDSSFIRSGAFNSEPFQNILIETSKFLKNVSSDFIAVFFGLLGGILSAVLILVISFYFIVEDRGIEKFVETVIPYDLRPRALRIIKKTESKLGKWFIGQLFSGFIVGLLSFIGLSILGVPYAIVLAIIAGVMELIPYIGPTLSGIPAVLIAFTVSPVLAVFTFILYFLIQQLEGYLITPKIMEKSVGLHPVVIIIAMLIGGQLAGITGIILAIPVTTIISIILGDFYSHNYKEKGQ